MNKQENLVEIIRYKLKNAPTQLKVFNLLSDKKWHCRGHETKEKGKDWPCIHQRRPEAEEGCVGCGWYDFAAWRNALNEKLNQSDQ